MAKPVSEEKIQEWKETITSQKESGLPIEHWCRQNNIPPHSFYYWKKKLLPIPELNRSSFNELANKKETGVFFEVNGLRLYVDSVFDPGVLKECLKALREFTC